MPDEPTSLDPLPIRADEEQPNRTVESPSGEKGLGLFWENLVRMGLGEVALRVGSGLASIALILLVVWVMGNFYLKGEVNTPQPAAIAAAPTNTPQVSLPTLSPLQGSGVYGITRLAQLRTLLPSRPRFEITYYTVQPGDTVI